MEKEEESCRANDEFEEFVQTLEQQQNWDGGCLLKYDGFWFRKKFLRPILSSCKNFKANDTDNVLSTISKSGTTWLKALTFSIINRNAYAFDQSPLHTSNPHKLVPFLELDVYMEHKNPDHHIPCPRIFATHVPFKVLPQSILESECKIIHVCRNPMDQFVSYYHFLLENKFEEDEVSLELDRGFDKFCQGIHSYGPFWEHMLGYWNASVKSPKKVLFLKYEDMQKDITLHVKKIADFLECPFSDEDEMQGLPEQISRLCSFEKLSKLDVNTSGLKSSMAKNYSFFRKGKVGDWINYLTPSMARRMRGILDDKLVGTNLVMKI